MDVQLVAPSPLTWRPSRTDDGPAIAELRAGVLRGSLERLGRYDEVGVRQRFLSAFVPGQTRTLQAPHGIVGSIALRPTGDATWLEHFYLHSGLQGQGLGTALLVAVTDVADATGTTLRLTVLQGSPARRLYERHGFVLGYDDPVDVFLQRRPARPRSTTQTS